MLGSLLAVFLPLKKNICILREVTSVSNKSLSGIDVTKVANQVLKVDLTNWL